MKLSVIMSALALLMVAYTSMPTQVSAQAPTFIISLIAPYKTTYDLGESVLIYVRIQNTGSASIDHAWGYAAISGPNGQLVMNQGFDSDCYNIAPGAICVFQVTWYMSGSALQGSYRILAGVNAAIGSTQRAQSETNCSGTCTLNFVVVPEFSDLVPVGAAAIIVFSLFLVHRKRRRANMVSRTA
jgi:hypothetical protein